MTRRKSYHFSLGNSSDGAVGMCLRVLANSKSEAVRIVQEILDKVAWNQRAVSSTIEYVCFYTNPEAVTEADIDEWEWE